MMIGTAIKKILKEKKITQVTYATKMLGEKSQGVISSRFSRSDGMTIKLAMEMLEPLDYEIVIQPKKRGRRAEDQILITLEDE